MKIKTDKLPNAIESEIYILGSCLMFKDALIKALNIISSETFYKKEHQLIFSAIYELFKENKPVDIISVAGVLNKNHTLEEIGGRAYLSELCYKVGSDANIEYHCMLIFEKYMYRFIIEKCQTAIDEAINEEKDCFELQERLIDDISGLGQNQFNAKNLKQLAIDFYKYQDFLRADNVDYIKICFNNLNNYLSGLKNGNLNIIAARPSVGKTAFALNLLSELDNVYFFSIESTAKEIFARYLSIISETNCMGFVPDGLLSEISKNIKKIEDKNIFINDTAGITIEKIVIESKKAKKLYNIQFIIIDYLQLIKYKSSNRNSTRDQEIGVVIRRLKELAKELDLPVLVLCQLNREAEGKKPALNMLRESGNIEQDADVVMFLHKSEQADKEIQFVDLTVAKNRNGKCFKSFTFEFKGECFKFKELNNESNFIPF